MLIANRHLTPRNRHFASEQICLATEGSQHAVHLHGLSNRQTVLYVLRQVGPGADIEDSLRTGHDEMQSLRTAGRWIGKHLLDGPRKIDFIGRAGRPLRRAGSSRRHAALRSSQETRSPEEVPKKTQPHLTCRYSFFPPFRIHLSQLQRKSICCEQCSSIQKCGVHFSILQRARQLQMIKTG